MTNTNTVIEWKSVKGLEWFKIDNEMFDLLVGAEF